MTQFVLEQGAAALCEARPLAEQPVIECDADPGELLEQFALAMRGKLAAMRALGELRRKHRQRIDPAIRRLQPDRLAIREDQILGERTERNDGLAKRLSEASASLEFRHPVPQQGRETAAREPVPAREAEATQDCAGFAAPWQNVAAQIGRRPHWPENLDAGDS